MVKCLVGEEPLTWNTGRYIKPRSIQNQMCPVCNSGAFETVKHFLFECPALGKSRESFIETLRDVCDTSEEIIVNRNSKAIIAAEMYVGVDFKSKLMCLGESVYNMYKERHQCQCRELQTHLQ